MPFAEPFLTRGADTGDVASKLGVVIALAVLASASASGTTARDSSPFPSGWIALPITLRGGIEESPELFRIRTDGTGLHQMTNGPGRVEDPSFAPNGKRLVFARSGRGIFTIRLDGSGLRQLTLHAHDQHPVYSPDGTRIAFVRADRLYVMQSDGRRQRLLRRAPHLRLRPSWSPDGNKIVIGDGDSGDAILHVLDARTGRALKHTLLMEGDLARGFHGPLLAPNGRTIVFEAYRPPPPECLGLQCEVYALYQTRLARGVESTRVVCNDCSASDWSADSRVLLIARRHPLELRVVRDGRTKVVNVRGIAPERAYLDGTPTLQPR